MANIKSAKKRIRVIAAKTLENKNVKTGVKTAIKKANTAVDTNADNKEAAVRAAFKSVDRACAKGVLHKNTAARRKSAVARKLNAAQ